MVRRQEIVEPLLFVDTQEGALFARGGRLVRRRAGNRSRWRFSDRHEASIEGRSLADLRRHVPWLPGEAELQPVLHTVRTGSALRLRGLATRDLTLVVETWGFSGPFAAVDQHAAAASLDVASAPPTAEAPPAGGAASPATGLAHRGTPTPGSGAGPPPANGAAHAHPARLPPTAVLAPRWYVLADDGPPHDRAYLSAVLAEHAAVLGCEQGRPAPRWDPLATGLELLGRLPPGLPAPPRLLVHRADRLPMVLTKVIRLQGLRLASCVDGLRFDRHPEYVHDARVAMRRARFALRVAAFHGDPHARALRDELRVLARLLGAVRDLDVLIPRLAELAAAARPDPAGHGPPRRLLMDALRARRTERLAPVAEMLHGTAILRLQDLLSGWDGAGVVDEPVERVAATAVRTALARATKAGRAVTGRAAPRARDLHRLRLRLKRVRYTAELFAGALNEQRGNRALAAIVKRCTAAQTSLGELNDDAVAAAEIRAIVPAVAEWSADPVPGVLAPGILDVLDRRQRAAAVTFQRQWPRLRTRLAEAVAEL